MADANQSNAPLTTDQLTALFPGADPAYLDKVASELNTDLSKYGLDTALRKAHFFAQVMQEAGAALESQTEGLNYSPKALMKFSYYVSHPAEAQQDGYARDPATGKITRHANEIAIANKAYANRIGNGDVASGDGSRFLGRGFIQVTGRANYTALAAQYRTIYGAGGADFVATPELVATFPFTVRSAVCFWIQHGLQKLADKGNSDANVDAITAVINANTDSKENRRDNFKRTCQIFQ